MQKTQTIFGFFWATIKPYRWWYLLIFQAPVISAFYLFANNYSLKLLIDAFASETETSYHHLMYPISLFIGAQVILEIAWRLYNYAVWKSQPYVQSRLLLSAYDYVQYHSYGYFQNTPTGNIISKLKGISDGYNTLFENLSSRVGKNICVVVLSILVLLLVSKLVALFMLLWCVIVLAILVPMALKLNRLSNQAAESKHSIVGLFSDNISNIFSLFYFSKRQQELKRAETLISNDLVPKQVMLERYNFTFQVIGSLLYWIMLIFILLFMVSLKLQHTISTGDFIFVMLTTIFISFDFWMLVMGLCDLMKDIGDLKASFSLVSTPHGEVDNQNVKELSGAQTGTIAFEQVSFAYADSKPIFLDLNLSITAGEKIGIIGHSGAGKSSLISLLLKNFKPNSGAIFFNHQDISNISTDSLRAHIALIPQDIMLFHRTIRENIGYAKDNASFETIQAAAKMANIDEWIETLAEKYDTLVGERGVKLSGGQRQRIAIARAILKNAPVIVLDEATSSLDSITEQEIQQSINALLEQKNTTVIAIAHRLSTIRHMDRIVVMEGGRIIEEGKFQQLMDNPSSYFKILWEAQVNGMVL